MGRITNTGARRTRSISLSSDLVLTQHTDPRPAVTIGRAGQWPLPAGGVARVLSAAMSVSTVTAFSPPAPPTRAHAATPPPIVGRASVITPPRVAGAAIPPRVVSVGSGRAPQAASRHYGVSGYTASAASGPPVPVPSVRRTTVATIAAHAAHAVSTRLDDASARARPAIVASTRRLHPAGRAHLTACKAPVGALEPNRTAQAVVVAAATPLRPARHATIIRTRPNLSPPAQTPVVGRQTHHVLPSRGRLTTPPLTVTPKPRMPRVVVAGSWPSLSGEVHVLHTRPVLITRPWPSLARRIVLPGIAGAARLVTAAASHQSVPLILVARARIAVPTGHVASHLCRLPGGSGATATPRPTPRVNRAGKLALHPAAHVAVHPPAGPVWHPVPVVATSAKWPKLAGYAASDATRRTGLIGLTAPRVIASGRLTPRAALAHGLITRAASPSRHDPMPRPTIVAAGRYPLPRAGRTSFTSNPISWTVAGLPLDLPAAAIQWLRQYPGITAAFGEVLPGTPKLFGDWNLANTKMPYLVYQEIAEGNYGFQSIDAWGQTLAFPQGQFQISIFSTEKRAGRVLAEQVAAALNDAPLTFGDGVLLEMRLQSIHAIPEGAIGTNGSASAYHFALVFLYCVQRNLTFTT